MSRDRAVVTGVLWALACTSAEPSGPRVADLTVVPSRDTIGVGDTLRLRAIVRDARGDTLSAVVVRWSVAPPYIASFQQGLLLGMATGTVTVTASVDGISDTAVILVAVPGTRVTVSGPTDSIWVGDTIRFAARVTGPNGEIATLDTSVTWTSSDGVVATVSATGLVRARQGGSAFIIAATGRGSDSAIVRIRYPVANVTVTPDTATLLPTGTVQLAATLRDTNGTLLGNRPVSWSSSDTVHAIVSSYGLVQGRSTGLATITATSEGRSDTAQVRVRPVTFTDLGGVASLLGCGLSADSIAYCWQGGLPSPATTAVRFTALDLGSFSDTCGVSGADSSVYCWLGTFSNAEVIAIPGSRRLREVSAGGEPSCGIATDSTAWCWAGNGTVVGPAAVGGALRFTAIASGFHRACGIAVDSTAYCWRGQGQADSAGSTTPRPVAGAPTLKTISVGAGYTCGLTAAGTAYCWVADSLPAPVVGGHAFATISAGYSATCAITVDGTGYCWGAGTGNSAYASSLTPVPIEGDLTFLTIHAGGSGARCGLATAGLYCWGSGNMGVEGMGGSLVPLRVSGQP